MKPFALSVLYVFSIVLAVGVVFNFSLLTEVQSDEVGSVPCTHGQPGDGWTCSASPEFADTPGIRGFCNGYRYFLYDLLPYTSIRQQYADTTQCPVARNISGSNSLFCSAQPILKNTKSDCTAE